MKQSCYVIFFSMNQWHWTIWTRKRRQYAKKLEQDHKIPFNDHKTETTKMFYALIHYYGWDMDTFLPTRIQCNSQHNKFLLLKALRSIQKRNNGHGRLYGFRILWCKWINRHWLSWKREIYNWRIFFIIIGSFVNCPVTSNCFQFYL